MFQIFSRTSVGPVEVPITAEGGSGSILLYRDREKVTLDPNGIIVPPGNYAVHLVPLPHGFGFDGLDYFTVHSPGVRGPGQVLGMYTGRWLSWVWAGDGSFARPTTPLHGKYSYRTTEPMPTGGA